MLIDACRSRGKAGYNILRGAPHMDARYHAMQSAKKMKKNKT